LKPTTKASHYNQPRCAGSLSQIPNGELSERHRQRKSDEMDDHPCRIENPPSEGAGILGAGITAAAVFPRFRSVTRSRYAAASYMVEDVNNDENRGDGVWMCLHFYLMEWPPSHA